MANYGDHQRRSRRTSKPSGRWQTSADTMSDFQPELLNHLGDGKLLECAARIPAHILLNHLGDGKPGSASYHQN